jgi:hypothetical protein
MHIRPLAMEKVEQPPMRDLSYGIHSAAQIGGKHLQAFVRHRLESGMNGVASRWLPIAPRATHEE